MKTDPTSIAASAANVSLTNQMVSSEHRARENCTQKTSGEAISDTLETSDGEGQATYQQHPGPERHLNQHSIGDHLDLDG